MQQIPRGVYTKEFREQAVRLVLEEGYRSRRRASGCRCRPRPWPAGWGQHAAGELATLGGQRTLLTESERELIRLRRELVEVTMERDI